MSGNNPFRIDNIVNGTSYNISVSLRNDFGESGQTTALYGESKAISVTYVGLDCWSSMKCSQSNLVQKWEFQSNSKQYNLTSKNLQLFC